MGYFGLSVIKLALLSFSGGCWISFPCSAEVIVLEDDGWLSFLEF